MEPAINVAVIGASGRMGREVVKLVLNDKNLALAAAVSLSKSGIDAGTMVGLEPCNVVISDDLERALIGSNADVMVDFTTPQTAMIHTVMAIRSGIRPVIGTTGFSERDIEELDKLCKEQELGCIIAPNFSIGAILMMKFAAQAAKHMPHVEIIEYHGDQKLDAPSGTSVKTAEMIAQNRSELKQGNPKEEEKLQGARGAYYDGFRIHSVRLPGVFAQQEVIFGGDGQTLKIRHDSYERSGYMPGVKMAVEKVLELDHLVYGLDQFVE